MFEHGGNFLPPYSRQPGGNFPVLSLTIPKWNFLQIFIVGCIRLKINSLGVTNRISTFMWLFSWCKNCTFACVKT